MTGSSGVGFRSNVEGSDANVETALIKDDRDCKRNQGRGSSCAQYLK